MNDPQSYLNNLYSWNNLNLECFYLAIQVGSTDMNEIFGLAGTFVTSDSKLTSTQRQFLWHGGDANLEIIMLIQDLLQPRWFVQYI